MPAEHIASTEAANVLLSGDADMLMDRNWIQQRSIFGAQIPQAFANNGDFFLNAVEQMAGGAALADLRGRAVDWRPLTRIEAMERAAEAEYRATEQALLDRIATRPKPRCATSPRKTMKGTVSSAPRWWLRQKTCVLTCSLPARSCVRCNTTCAAMWRHFRPV